MLELRDVSFLRGDEPVLEGVSFRVAPGEVLVIRGANGSGKTTLLKVIAGLLRPEDGAAIRLDDRDEDPAGPAFRQELMLIGHQLGLKLELTSIENQTFFAAFVGGGGLAPRESLRAVGLRGYDHTIALRLSAGQRKRLALARLLLGRQRLWLLDEPYSNLDQPGIELVDGLLGDHAAVGGMAVITSHGTFEPRGPVVRELRL